MLYNAVMATRAYTAMLRSAFALLALTAIGVQLSIHVRNGFDVLNFFSYFTNLSNILAAGVLLVAAAHDLTGRQASERFTLLRGASVVAMAIVGIVFAAVLRNEDLGTLRPWVNVVLHYVMPLAVVLDWVLAPPERVPSFRRSLLWLVFPALYLVYTLARGTAVGWYPYPFLNPNGAHGYGGVAVACASVAALFFVVGIGGRAAARRTPK